MSTNIYNNKTLYLIAFICSLLFITGCGKKEIPEEYNRLMHDKSGNVVRLGFYGAPSEINPIKAAESEHDKMFCNLVFAAPLIKLEKGKYEPYLFESFDMRLDGEKLVVNGKWRQDLKWHDNVAFDVSEFEYSLEQMKLPEINSPYSDASKSILSVKKDGYNIEITFPNNSKKYLDLLCAGILPAHLLAKDKIASGTVEEAYENFIKNPVGLGPYKVVDNRDYKYMLLEPNTNFYDGKGAKRPKIAIICSYELQQTISDFRDDQLDWMSAPSMIAEQLKNLGVENIIFKEHPNPAVLTWVFNTRNGKLKDVKIRKALNLILDRECAKHQFGTEATELFDNLIPVDSNNKKYETERFEEGKKLLEEAGLVDTNNDGLRDYNGDTYKLSISINNDSISRRLIAEKIIERLKTVGIQAEIKSVSWNDFVSSELKGHQFETALLSYHISNDCSMKDLFGSPSISGDNGLNFTGIIDEGLDRELITLDSAVTNENKAMAYNAVNEKLSALCPCAFLIRASDMALVHGSPVKTVKSNNTLWDDILTWNIMFGKEASKQ